MANIFGERLIQRFRLLLENARGDADPRVAKLGKSLPADQRIRILHARDDAGDSGRD